jgi:hypothetical protein
MANGTNGTDPLNASWLSKHVRPTVAWLSLGIYAVGLFSVLPYLIKAEQWGFIGALLAVPVGFVGWYFGVRNQEKDKDTLKTLTNTVAKIVDALPKADSGTTTSAVEDVEPAVEEKPVPIKYEYRPFDEATFDAYIETLVADYKEPASRATQKFDRAWAHGIAEFDWKDPTWISYIGKLLNLWFSSVWGLYDEQGNLMDSGALEYADLHRNDELGCTTCKGGPGCTYPNLEFKANEFGGGYLNSFTWMQHFKEYIEGKFLPWQENYVDLARAKYIHTVE